MKDRNWWKRFWEPVAEHQTLFRFLQAKLWGSLTGPYAEEWFLRTQQNKGQHLLTRYTTEANFGQFKGLMEHPRKNIHTLQQSARKVNSTLCLIYRY